MALNSAGWETSASLSAPEMCVISSGMCMCSRKKLDGSERLGDMIVENVLITRKMTRKGFDCDRQEVKRKEKKGKIN